jgi:hypothetical protein
MKQAKTTRGIVSWYNTDYWLFNGFLFSELAHSALCDLITIKRFPDLDTAIGESILMLLEENSATLVRHDKKWLYLWGDLRKQFRKAPGAKPDRAGAENLRLVEKMHTAMAVGDGS